MTEIAFRGVRLKRGGTSVLHGLDLDIEPGETVALVGRSGAGKSTILKLINGLLVPDAGDVVVAADHVETGIPSSCAVRSATCSRRSGCSRT